MQFNSTLKNGFVHKTFSFHGTIAAVGLLFKTILLSHSGGMLLVGFYGWWWAGCDGMETILDGLRGVEHRLYHSWWFIGNHVLQRKRNQWQGTKKQGH